MAANKLRIYEKTAKEITIDFLVLSAKVGAIRLVLTHLAYSYIGLSQRVIHVRVSLPPLYFYIVLVLLTYTVC